MGHRLSKGQVETFGQLGVDVKAEPETVTELVLANDHEEKPVLYDWDMKAFCKILPAYKNVRLLDLAGQGHMRKDGMLHLCKVLPKLESLEILSLAELTLDTTVMEKLMAALVTLPKLRLLNLYDGLYGDSGKVLFKRLPETTVEILHLGKCESPIYLHFGVAEAGALLARAAQEGCLRVVYLSENESYKEESFRELVGPMEAVGITVHLFDLSATERNITRSESRQAHIQAMDARAAKLREEYKRLGVEPPMSQEEALRRRNAAKANAAIEANATNDIHDGTTPIVGRPNPGSAILLERVYDVELRQKTPIKDLI